MKKVLIIAGDFVPYSPSLGGVIRILTLSDFLYKNGYDIYIITSKSFKFGYFGYEELIKKFHIHYIDNKIQSYIFKSTVDKKKLLDNNLVVRNGFNNCIKKIIIAIKYKLKNLVYELAVPDINIFMKSKFYKKSLELIEANGIKNLLISSPPHSMHVVGAKIKKRLKDKINYIIDYRDSWNTIRLFSKKNIISKYISRNYEKQVLLICDFFSYISNPMLAKIEKLYKIEIKTKSRLIMNGFVEEIKTDTTFEKNDKIRIGYFGAISDSSNSMRNISRLLDLLIRKAGLFDFLEFHFYGDVTISNHEMIKLPMIHLHESINHKEALTEMMKMDYLMLIHSDKQSSDEVITGKFFEYIAARKIVICIGPEDMEAKRIIDKYNIGINIDIDDDNDMEVKLLSMQNPDKTGFYKNLDVNIFKRDAQYKTFLNLLK